MEKPRVLVFIYILWLLPGYFFAQKNTTKIIVDSKTKLPLDYVSIQSDNVNIRLVSNKDGRFILINDTSIKSFVFYKLGYHSKTIKANELEVSDTIFLKQKEFILEEVVIQSKKIDTLVRDKRFYVEDYYVLPGENFLLITSKINVSGIEVCHYNKATGIRQVKKIKDETNAKFVTDCFKNVHVVTDVCSRQILFDSDTSFNFLAKYPRRIFDSVVTPCALKIDTHLILKAMAPPKRVDFRYLYIKINAPFFNYYKVSKSSRDLFYTIAYNDRMMEMIEHEIEDTRATARNEFVADNIINMFFTHVAAPLYAPLFLVNDTVVLFNFQQNSIVFLNKTGSILKVVKLNEDDFISIHGFEVLYDEPNGKFYMKMVESDRPQIKQINIYTGRAVKKVKIEKTFARNVQIVNGRIYYLVREKEWDDTQYLYQQN